jgi:hypothetical protein
VKLESLAALALVICTIPQSSDAAKRRDPIPELMAVTYKIANPDSTGTCFLISRPAKSGQTETILVTAAHVFEKMSGANATLVLRNKEPDGRWLRKEVPLKIREKDAPLWTRHPDADVAALVLRLPADATFEALPAEQIAADADFENGNIRTGDEVWLFCYPAKLEANASGFPILRRGAVASYPLTPATFRKEFLVDTPSFGGNSGAPVVMFPRQDNAQDRSPQRPRIIGLVSGMHRQTDKATMDLAEVTFNQPLGLSIIVSAEYIRQTLDRIPRGNEKK